MKYLILVLTLSLVIFSACKKDDSKTKTDLLTQKGWVATSIKYSPKLPYDFGNGNVVDIADLFDIYDDCAKDDELQFFSSGNYKILSNDKCNYEMDIFELGNWAFNSNETRLYYGIIDYLYEYEILTLNDNQLVLKTIIAIGDSISSNTYTETSTYEHK